MLEEQRRKRKLRKRVVGDTVDERVRKRSKSSTDTEEAVVTERRGVQAAVVVERARVTGRRGRK